MCWQAATAMATPAESPLARFAWLFFPFHPSRLNESQLQDPAADTFLGSLPMPTKAVVPNYIGMAIPYFLLLVAIESVVVHLKQRRAKVNNVQLNVAGYRLNDSINSLSLGTISQVSILTPLLTDLSARSWCKASPSRSGLCRTCTCGSTTAASNCPTASRPGS